MTWKRFLKRLGKRGWVLLEQEEIARANNDFICPWLYVDGLTATFSRLGKPSITKEIIWRAADNRPGRSSAIRKELLVACGLVK